MIIRDSSDEGQKRIYLTLSEKNTLREEGFLYVPAEMQAKDGKVNMPDEPVVEVTDEEPVYFYAEQPSYLIGYRYNVKAAA